MYAYNFFCDMDIQYLLININIFIIMINFTHYLIIGIVIFLVLLVYNTLIDEFESDKIYWKHNIIIALIYTIIIIGGLLLYHKYY